MDVLDGRTWCVIQGDALAVLRTLPDECVDAVVTDPPFGIGFVFDGVREAANTPEGYWEWLGPICSEWTRCLKPGGFCAVWQSQLYFRHFWEWFGNDIHIYCAAKNFVQLRPTIINYGYDPVVMFYKPSGDPLRPEKPKRNIDFYLANTAGIISQTGRVEKAHPCPKPIDLMAEVITNFVRPGSLVLDAFTGSGSTGVAALLNDYRFLGVEISPLFHELACQRIGAAYRGPSRAGQLSLFSEEAA